MSASKAEKYRFWVAYFLDNLEEGDTFTHGWLHMTIVPWFVSEMPDKEVINSFEKVFSKFKRFNIYLGEKIIFGGKKRAPVTSIVPSEEVIEVHAATLRWFDQLGGRWAVKNPHVGKDYRPHIRHRRGKRILAVKLTVDSLVLVKARRQEDWVREVAAKVELK